MYYANTEVSPAEQIKDFVCETLGYRKFLQLLKEKDQDVLYTTL